MKDLPQQRKKINRRVIRSVHQDATSMEAMPPIPPRKLTEKQIKKQAKQKIAQEKKARSPRLPDLEERNKKMKHRVPVLDRASADKPPSTKPTHKKTPPI